MKNKVFLTVFCTLLAIAFSAVVLWLLGFRITYAPNLENSWDAISACAGWAGAIFSLIAILVAIQIPKKIADEQNNIALFEKRHNFYITFCRCISFGEAMGEIKTCEEARRLFYIMLSDNAAECDDETLGKAIATLQIRTVGVISQASYLFAVNSDDLLESLLNDIVDVLSPNKPQEEFSIRCERLTNSTKAAKEQLTSNFERTLNTINKP